MNIKKRRFFLLVLFISMILITQGFHVKAAERESRAVTGYTSNANGVKKGYHVDSSKPVLCKHLPSDSAYIYVELKSLKNTKSQLINNVKLVKNGNLAFDYTISTSTVSVSGEGSNKVSGNVLTATIQGNDFDLAYPYVCKEDGHAGYTYIKCYFSYCGNTDRWYFLGSSHYWLGCSRGDIGENETHTSNYSHNIYAWEKNKGTIRYHGNKGTALEQYFLSSSIVNSVQNNLPLVRNYHYETAEINLHNVGTVLARSGYHIETEDAWLINSTKGIAVTQDKTTEITQFKKLIENGEATVTLYANWKPNTYKISFDANGGEGTMEEGTFYYDKTDVLPQNQYQNNGYIFAGWNTKRDGTGKFYQDKAEIKNITDKNNVTLYLFAQWVKDIVHIAYNGNGQSIGTNLIDSGIGKGDPSYTLKENLFEKIIVEEDNIAELEKPYKREVMYSFQGWSSFKDKNSEQENLYTPQGVYPVAQLYHTATTAGAVSKGKPAIDEQYIWDKESTKETSQDEFINLYAVWNAFPDIIPTQLEDEDIFMDGVIPVFYEGQEVKKEDLIRNLVVFDKEDGDLVDKVCITKIEYASSKIKEEYDLEWESDVPIDFTLDTYYMELEEDEIVEHKITFSVTDSSGNTTTAVLPVKVRYNHYPEIHADEELYFFKEEINQNKITEDVILQKAEVFDLEDGERIKNKLELLNFDAEKIKRNSESLVEYEVLFKVTDAYNKTTYKPMLFVILDPDAVVSQLPKRYIRFISEKHLNTLEETSVWRQEENLEYLKGILKNTSPKSVWHFSSKDIEEIKKWITEDGDGNWKAGEKANKEFLTAFSGCRKK